MDGHFYTAEGLKGFYSVCSGLVIAVHAFYIYRIIFEWKICRNGKQNLYIDGGERLLSEDSM